MKCKKCNKTVAVNYSNSGYTQWEDEHCPKHRAETIERFKEERKDDAPRREQEFEEWMLNNPFHLLTQQIQAKRRNK